MRFVALFAALLLSACVTVGDENRIEPDYEAASRINSQLGLDYFQQGKLELARAKLRKAISQDAQNPYAYMGEALIYARLQDFESAESFFQKALKISPHDEGLLQNYGAYACETGQKERAIETFLKIARDSRYAQPESAYTSAGMCARKYGDLNVAEEYFRKALVADAAYAPALKALGSLSFEAEDFLRARAFLHRLELVGRADAESLLMRMRTEFALGDRLAAWDYGQKLKKLVPDIGQRIDLKTGQAR